MPLIDYFDYLPRLLFTLFISYFIIDAIIITDYFHDIFITTH